jgi:hypothetical protein
LKLVNPGSFALGIQLYVDNHGMQPLVFIVKGTAIAAEKKAHEPSAP